MEVSHYSYLFGKMLSLAIDENFFESPRVIHLFIIWLVFVADITRALIG